MKTILVKPLYFSIKKIAKPILIFSYRQHLNIRQKLYHTYSRSPFKIPVRLVHQYSSVLTIIILVSFVVTNNIYAQSEAQDLLYNHSLVYTLIYGNDDSEEIIEEGYVRPNQINLAQAANLENHHYVDENDTDANISQISATKTMAGGNTLVKPTITSDSPLVRQQLRDSIDYHIVEQGESLSEIAEFYGISVNTILWENKLRSKQLIRPGQKLTILPTSGISHIVKRGENINRIARNYNSDADKILSFNELDPGTVLKTGQRLIIPEGSPTSLAINITPKPTISQKISDVFTDPKSSPGPSPNASSAGMIWPTPGHVITQYYSWRHTGLDVDGITGDPIYAVADATVEISGWNNYGYGFQVVLDHGNNMKTRYAHCSKLLYNVGDSVSKGDTICLMGSTGHSTGSHLHFEVIDNGVRRNPLSYIKK